MTPWEFNHLDLEDRTIEEVLATMGISSVILTDEVVEVEAVEDGEVGVEMECFVEVKIMDLEDAEGTTMGDLKEIGATVRPMVIHVDRIILMTDYSGGEAAEVTEAAAAGKTEVGGAGEEASGPSENGTRAMEIR